MTTTPKDRQVGGDHYQTPIQPIDYILANNLDFCEGSIVKYITRWRKKGGVQDLEKIIHYAEFLIHDARQREASDQTSQPHRQGFDVAEAQTEAHRTSAKGRGR